MRKLNGKDAFRVAKIIKKSGLKNQLEELYSIASKKNDYTKVGIKVMFTIVEACANEGVDGEVFAFLDDILEVSDTVSMDLFELIEMLKEYSKVNDLKRFLSLVGLSL